MGLPNKTCEWFGHREESTGSQVGDFTSEGFKCSRCGDVRSVFEGSLPPPAPKIRFYLYALLTAGLLGALLYFTKG
jgi:hypothetical protein